MTPSFSPRRLALAVFLASALTAAAQAPLPGADLPALLALARARNPDVAAMRSEAQAATERVTSASAFPDPRFRVELMDITRMGEQSPSLWPSNVGGTKYTLTQELPWFGKRDLRRDIASLDASGAQGKARSSWFEVAAKVKVAHAQRQALHGNRTVMLEILALMVQLEKVAQARYAKGLTAQQDVIRAQVEQTSLRGELLNIDTELRQANARLNALLARPPSAPLAEPAGGRPWPAPAQLDYRSLETRVREHNPQLFADTARVKSAQKGVDLALLNRIPDFTVGIQPTQYQNSFKEWTVMLEVNIPLQQETRRAQERESQAMLDAARARQEATAQQVLSELAEQLAALEAARHLEALVRGSLLPQAELTFQSALVSYEATKVDFATLLDAQRQIRQARQSLIRAQQEAQIRLAEIEKLTGDEP